MKIQTSVYQLQMAHRWAVSSNASSGGRNLIPTVLLRLTDSNGITGFGEAPTTARYRQPAESILAFLNRIDPEMLAFEDPLAGIQIVRRLAEGNESAKGAVEMALLDGHCKARGMSLHQHFGLAFTEDRHVTTFSIGIDDPSVIRAKVLAAAGYPRLKLKVGRPDDAANLAALRAAAPEKWVRVDANEAWSDREEALRQIEKFATDPRIEFVEQPMPATTPVEDMAWLKDRSPLPLYADESCQTVADVDRCAACFHGVNVKLIKTAGPLGAFETLSAARARGLKTMIGCMIETSVGISAGAHLADLADHLDLDGNLLVSNDPFEGVTAVGGQLSFRSAGESCGLQVRHRGGDGKSPGLFAERS